MAESEHVQINFFRPGCDRLRAEVGISRAIIVLWFLLSYGIPIVIWLAGSGDPSGLGESVITRSRFLGFPLHYWLMAQGCTVGYILLCKLYCVLWDRHHTTDEGESA